MIPILLLAAHHSERKLVPAVIQISGATITITERKYRPNHRMSELKKGQEFIEYRIDGRKVWGTDGGIPHTEIASFKLVWKHKQYSLPRYLWSDCFNLGTDQSRFKVRPMKGKPGAIIYKAASDSAGSYAVEWTIPFDTMKCIRNIKSTVI